MKSQQPLFLNSYAFTLIELLIVVAIIGVLIGIFLPGFRKARIQTNRLVCASKLKQIGVGFQSFLSENNDRFPHASFMPSVSPNPLKDQPIFIADVLLDHIGGEPEAFRCPKDESDIIRHEPNNGISYFESERSSYEYRSRPYLGGKSTVEITETFRRIMGRPIPDNMFWIMRDYNNFHGKAGKKGARRYLYSDGHVTDFEN